MDATTIVGVVAFALSAVQVVQMTRSVTTSSDPSGVSSATWLILLAQGVAWVVFGLAEGLWPSVAINALLVMMALLVVLKLLPGRPFGVVLVAGGAMATICALLAAGGSTPLVGWIAAACAIVAFIPQATALARTRDTSGLSLGSWTIGLVGVTCWLLYGIGLGTTQIVVSSVPPLVCSIIIVAALLRERLEVIEVSPA